MALAARSQPHLNQCRQSWSRNPLVFPPPKKWRYFVGCFAGAPTSIQSARKAKPPASLDSGSIPAPCHRPSPNGRDYCRNHHCLWPRSQGADRAHRTYRYHPNHPGRQGSIGATGKLVWKDSTIHRLFSAALSGIQDGSRVSARVCGPSVCFFACSGARDQVSDVKK